MAPSDSPRPAAGRTPTLAVRPHVISGALAVIAAVLVLFSAIGQVIFHVTGHDWAMGFIPLFHVAQENNISTLFASVIHLVAAVLVGLAGWRAWKMESKDARYWLGMSVIFTYMALDETAMIHERTIEPMREALGGTGLLYFTWVVPAMVAVVVVTLALAPFLLRLPRRTLGLFVLAGVLFVGGAVGMESIGGLYVEANDFETPVWSALTTVEEAMEMAGVIVFIHGVLGYLSDTSGGFRFALRSASADEGETAAQPSTGARKPSPVSTV